MGIFKQLFDYSAKVQYAKATAKRRIARVPELADKLHELFCLIDSADVMEASGFPEATVYTIVESYAGLRKRNVGHTAALSAIETTRRQLGAASVDGETDLAEYILNRICIEHGGAPGITEAWFVVTYSECAQRLGVDLKMAVGSPPPKLAVVPPAPPQPVVAHKVAQCAHCSITNVARSRAELDLSQTRADLQAMQLWKSKVSDLWTRYYEGQISEDAYYDEMERITK